MRMPRQLRGLFSPLGALGWLVVLIKPIRQLIEWLADVDFIWQNLDAIGRFLDTGWGTLTTVGLGALIVAHAVYRAGHIHRAKTKVPLAGLPTYIKEKKVKSKPFISAWQAIEYIYNYRLALEPHREDHLERTCDEFQQAALDGKIEVFGRPVGSDKYEKIGELFWNLGKIDPLQSQHPDGDGGVASSGDTTYIGVRVRQQQILDLWPKIDRKNSA